MRPLPVYLSAEEWIARHMPPGDYFFAWQVAPTVICGRHQDVASEVDLHFCAEHGIEVYRRKSGGGAVFADCNNIMFSHIAPAAAVQDAFSDYTSRVVAALRALGLDAEASGRNDILVGGKKVAGNAYYKCNDRSIVHGTMLYDTDAALMGGALTPARAKLESHKVVSVPSRITTVRSHLPELTLEAFMKHMLAYICDGDIRLPDEAASEIENISRPYFVETFGNESISRACAERVAGAGTVVAETVLSHDGIIKYVRLTGDFFALPPFDAAMARLSGVRHAAADIAAALGPEPIMAGIDNAALAACIAASTTVIESN